MSDKPLRENDVSAFRANPPTIDGYNYYEKDFGLVWPKPDNANAKTLVYMVQSATDVKRHFAMKVIPVPPQEAGLLLRREIGILNYLRRLEDQHPGSMKHLIVLRDVRLVMDGKFVCLFTDWNTGALTDVWAGKSRQKSVNAADRKLIAKGLLHALHVLHTCGIAHRDVKPQNVLIQYEGDSTRIAYARLADFGSARPVSEVAQDDVTNVMHRCTSFWVPFEALFRPFNVAVGTAAMDDASKQDLFSLGLVLAELVVCRGNTKHLSLIDDGREALEQSALEGALNGCPDLKDKWCGDKLSFLVRFATFVTLLGWPSDEDLPAESTPEGQRAHDMRDALRELRPRPDGWKGCLRGELQHHGASEPEVEVIMRLLSYDPQQRPSAEDLLVESFSVSPHTPHPFSVSPHEVPCISSDTAQSLRSFLDCVLEQYSKHPDDMK